jgi:hypothetical protein
MENERLNFMVSLNGKGVTTTVDAGDNGGNGTKGSGHEENGNRSQSVMSMSSAISLSDFEKDMQLQKYFGQEE